MVIAGWMLLPQFVTSSRALYSFLVLENLNASKKLKYVEEMGDVLCIILKWASIGRAEYELLLCN